MSTILNLFGIEPYSGVAFQEAMKGYFPGTDEQKRTGKIAEGKLNDVGIQALLFNKFHNVSLYNRSLESPEEAPCFTQPQGPNHHRVALFEDIFEYFKADNCFGDFDISSVYADSDQKRIEFRGMYRKAWGHRTVVTALYDSIGTKILFQSRFPEEFSKIVRTGNPLAEGRCDTLFKAYHEKWGAVAIPIPDLVEISSEADRKKYTLEGIKPYDYPESIFTI